MGEYAGPRQLRRLLDAVMSVASDLDLAAVLERIVGAAQELVGARYAALGVLDETKTYLTEFITVGLTDDQRAAIGELPKGHGILGLLIADPRPIRLPDLKEHADSFGFPPNHPPMTSFLGVPLYVRGEVFGNLYLTEKLDGEAFSDIDEELVQSLAAAAAMAIDNARLHEQAGEMTLLADRERIGRDLHDTVVQRLFATGLAMQGTARLVQRPEVAERLQQHITDIDNTIREVRTAIFELDVARTPGRASLRREILELTAGAARLLSFEPSVYLDGPIDSVVDDATAVHVIAVLREALSNITRHARASRVDVTIRANHDLAMEIADDGVGGVSSSTGGSGVRNILRRAEQLGGTAEVTSPDAGRGTVVRWQVPLSGS